MCGRCQRMQRHLVLHRPLPRGRRRLCRLLSRHRHHLPSLRLPRRRLECHRYHSMFARELGLFGEVWMTARTKRQSRAIPEDTCLRLGESEQALSHHLGSPSMMGRTAFVSIMAEHEDVEAALRSDRSPHDTPNLSDDQASDITTPTSYAGAMASEQALTWCNLISRGILGLLGADTFAAIQE